MLYVSVPMHTIAAVYIRFFLGSSTIYPVHLAVSRPRIEPARYGNSRNTIGKLKLSVLPVLVDK